MVRPRTNDMPSRIGSANMSKHGDDSRGRPTQRAVAQRPARGKTSGTLVQVDVLEPSG